MHKWLWDCSVWSVDSFSVKYDYNNPSRGNEERVCLRAPSTLTQTKHSCKVLLPDISEINPPKQTSQIILSQTKLYAFIVRKNMSRGLALGGFKRSGWETEAQSLLKGEEVCCLSCFAKMSPPLYSISSPGVATGWADRCTEIFWHFPRLLQLLSPRHRGGCWVLYQGAPERMINRHSLGPSPLEQQAGSSAGNKAQILSPKHSRGYNEACTKQTGESRPDKQFHIQSSTESEIESLSPAATSVSTVQRLTLSP